MSFAGIIPPPGSGTTIQAALRQSIITAIADGRLAAGQRMPPSRALAEQMDVARNTVIAVYDDLVARGFLVSIERRGYFVADGAETPAGDDGAAPIAGSVDWSQRLALRMSGWRNITKPADWQRYPYPFIYGQVDAELFPIASWRACSRDALGRSAVNYWAADYAMGDDPLLVEQICRHLLPARGILARPDEVLITLGSQQGLYLLSQLLPHPDEEVGIEDPGYADARNIFALSRGRVRPLPVDGEGLVVGPALDGLRLAVVTPSYQCPTMVTMPATRRQALLDWAAGADAVLVEDDYEGEMRFETALPALKSLDAGGRVIYLGTLSKVLAPGVRIGYMVGPAPLIAEARALRRLMHRSAPLNNQRTAAIFLAEGHAQGLVKSLRAAIRGRWEQVCTALARDMPDFVRSPAQGGSSVWLTCPPGIDGRTLYEAASRDGVLFEPGDPFFHDPPAQASFRLGLSSISEERIEEGIRRLAAAAARLP